MGKKATDRIKRIMAKIEENGQLQKPKAPNQPRPGYPHKLVESEQEAIAALDSLAAELERQERELTAARIDVERVKGERDELNQRAAGYLRLLDSRQARLDKALAALREADGFNDEVLREWRMEGDTKMCAEHVRRVLRVAIAEIEGEK